MLFWLFPAITCKEIIRMLMATKVFAIVFMALGFWGFVRTKLYPIRAQEKLIFTEDEIRSSENPEDTP
jgi:hypothetical protein